MAQQPWNIGGRGSTGLPSHLDSPSATPSAPGLPPDVVLLGPRDEAAPKAAAVPVPPTMPRFEAAKFEKPDLRPAPASYMPAPRRNPRTKRTVIGLSALVLVCVGIPSIAYLRSGSGAPTAPAPSAAPVVRVPTASAPAGAGAPAGAVLGSATIISRPEGAQVLVDGVAKGVTPLTLTLPLGSYTLELQNGAFKRSLPLVVESGFVVRQYIDLAGAPGETAGRLEISSEPTGAQVTVDGTARGVTPLTIGSIEPGQHRVTIAGADGTVNRTVNVAAGATASVVATLTPAGSSGGWVSIVAPFEMQVLENGQTIGSSAMDKLMLPAGKHDLTLQSDAFGLSMNVSVQVPAGKTANVPVVLPKNMLSINALPWAEVWLDGQPMGTTPLGNISVSVGNHEIVWKHPQLGERRQIVKVTAGAPVRAGMDFSK